MATNCIVLGETPVVEKKKPIEFVILCSGKISQTEFKTPTSNPSDWTNIELIARAVNENYYDTMFAYHDSREEGVIYFGHWNDGVAE